MAINSINELELRKPFIGPRGEMWEVQSYCRQPTVTMINRKTGKKIGGAVGCLNLEQFVALTENCPDGLLAVGNEEVSI